MIMARTRLNVPDNNSCSSQKGHMPEEMGSFRDAVDAVIQWVGTHSSPVREPYIQNNEISRAVFRLWSIF
jgi:hypothetical protein